jgi:hypothetical protein
VSTKPGEHHFVVALLLTLTFASISILAAGVVTRAVAAQQAGETITRGLVALCGGVVVLIAGFMTWHGLTWADAQAELIPGAEHDWLLIPAAGMLSLSWDMAHTALTAAITHACPHKATA